MGIRKLADLNTKEELSKPLYRAVRGTLPNSFWASDDHNLVSAVDTAFMSTSQSREASIGYMATDSENVLWNVTPKKQSDSAFHCGASINMLSQFASEAEVLFPPCTMLNVQVKEECDVQSVEDLTLQTDESGKDQAAEHWRNKRMSRFEVESKQASAPNENIKY